MPIKEGRAKLWFKTQEQINEYDDRMIASIELKSNNFDDENYTPIFSRNRKEFLLQPNQLAISSARKFKDITSNQIDYINKYHSGKRDHTYFRDWTYHKYGFGYGIAYLLFRELPIRNFYARCTLMFVFLAKVHETSNLFSGDLMLTAIEDEWSDKQVRNYGIYYDQRHQIIPSNYNRVPEGRVWKMQQPAFLRDTPSRFLGTLGAQISGYNTKQIDWDGTFNMPTEGLAHHLHKDSKNIDFITC